MKAYLQMLLSSLDRIVQPLALLLDVQIVVL
jgi:hypothetical protein